MSYRYKVEWSDRGPYQFDPRERVGPIPRIGEEIEREENGDLYTVKYVRHLADGSVVVLAAT